MKIKVDGNWIKIESIEDALNIAEVDEGLIICAGKTGCTREMDYRGCCECEELKRCILGLGYKIKE